MYDYTPVSLSSVVLHPRSYNSTDHWNPSPVLPDFPGWQPSKQFVVAKAQCRYPSLSLAQYCQTA